MSFRVRFRSIVNNRGMDRTHIFFISNFSCRILCAGFDLTIASWPDQLFIHWTRGLDGLCWRSPQGLPQIKCVFCDYLALRPHWTSLFYRVNSYAWLSSLFSIQTSYYSFKRVPLQSKLHCQFTPYMNHRPTHVFRKLIIPTFSGDYSQWPHFWELFSSLILRACEIPRSVSKTVNNFFHYGLHLRPKKKQHIQRRWCPYFVLLFFGL